MNHWHLEVSLNMSKVCKLLSGTPETKNVAVADKTAFVRFCLAIFMNPP